MGKTAVFNAKTIRIDKEKTGFASPIALVSADHRVAYAGFLEVRGAIIFRRAVLIGGVGYNILWAGGKLYPQVAWLLISSSHPNCVPTAFVELIEGSTAGWKSPPMPGAEPPNSPAFLARIGV
jgi:hypothetical protein